MKSIHNYNQNVFDYIKHVDELGNEYREVRKLQKLLQYKVEKILKCYQ